MEDAVCRDGKLVVTIFAIENFQRVNEPDNWPFAAWALWFIRPAKALQKLPAKIVIGERVAKLDNGHRRLLWHG
jgi:hypothetical protein